MTKRVSEGDTIDRIIQEILSNFDFEKCYRTMKFLGWRWGPDGTIPTIERLKKSGKDRIMSAIEGIKQKDVSYQKSYFSSSGGLKGTVYKNRYGNIINIQLEFILTDWESDGDS